MFARFAIALLFLAVPAFSAAGQGLPSSRSALGSNTGLTQAPETYEIMGIKVAGVPDESTSAFVRQTSGLAEGQQVTIPGDQAIADAVRSIYDLGMFDDVKIKVDRKVGNGVYLTIQVEEVPKLADYSFSGVDASDDLKEKIPLIKRSPVRPGDVERARQVIRAFYEDEGYLDTQVNVRREEGPNNSVNLTFLVDRGEHVEVENIQIAGNTVFSDRRLRSVMSDTKEDRWWRFWKSETFNEEKFQGDLQKVINFYNNHGYYDAHFVRDTTYVRREGGDTDMVVEMQLHEGPKYHIRNIEWEGNTVVPDRVLTQALGFEKGDVYDGQQLQMNLRGNPQKSDVSSIYMDRGYMMFNVQPRIREVGEDSLDLYFDISEGGTYEFGDVTIAGNTKTKEHVIRRELYTIPGQTFSRSAIQESIRRLQQLSYFSQESLQGGPAVEVDEENKEVDLTYNLQEVGSDQLELSGTWGRIGLILQLRFSFNNFSAQNLFNADAWSPLPTGDGQKLTVGVQTNGTYYQNYSLSFREPWFRGRPTPIGFSMSYSRYGGGLFSRGFGGNNFEEGHLVNGSVRTFYERRLQWPDDKFSTSTALQYQYYDNQDSPYGYSLPDGVSQEVTVQQSLSRNSINNPRFPTSGSSMSLSLEVAPPIGNFIQYHKWRFNTEWHAPLHEKVALSFGVDYGYIGSLTGGDVQFQRFVLGGSPFDTQGRYNYNYFGKDIVYMRGYPAGALGPRINNRSVGGRILNKYTSELRWNAIQSPQVSAAPYLFMDAANTWNGFASYNPVQLYRSAGVGGRVFLPMIGMVELVYGYNFDEFEPVNNEHPGDQQWYFQFSLGRGF